MSLAAALPAPPAEIRFSPARMALSAVCLLGLAAFAILGGFTVTITPAEPLIGEAMLGATPPSAGHVFGTDALGRDVFVRTLAAAGRNLGAAAAGFALVLALSWIHAAASTAAPQTLRTVLRWAEDTLCSFPPLALGVLAAAAAGGGAAGAVAGVTLALAPLHARALRLAVTEEMAAPHGIALRLSGLSETAVFLRDALPNALARLELPAIARPAGAIMLVATLGLFGFAARPGEVEWGDMIAEALRDRSGWWSVLFPMAAVVLSGLAAEIGTGGFGRRGRAS